MLRRLAAVFSRGSSPRTARLVGIGAPRTGTHSLAAMFDRSVRARHEPRFGEATRMVVAHANGRASAADLRAFVRRRDERLRLDVDASHVNVHLAATIAAEFADARFVLTIRDPFSWLASAIDHTRNSRRPTRTAREYLAFWFDTANDRHGPHDAPLRELGLPSIEGWLRAWRRHNDTAFAAVPADRLLVVRTDELTARRHDIATFAGITHERLVAGFVPKGRARTRHGTLAKLDAAYVADRVTAHCEPLLQRWFPDLRSAPDAFANEGPR